nr:DNA-directed DNA polymerase [Tanacetum cinerariifolium]
MADTRTVSELLQAPTDGYGDAIVLPPILAENFKLKVGLLQLVTSSQFQSFERDGPHAHIRWFNKITSTLNPDLPKERTTSFYSYMGGSRTKLMNHFFPPSKTTNLKNDITNFQQRFEESFLNNQKLQEKTNNQMLKFLQIFQRLHFDLSFVDALLHMPKFASTFKSLLSNKEKLFELASTPLNENYSTVLLKKLPKKLGDPGKFLIPCDFPELAECLALADLGASINLMPISVWKKLSLLELIPTHMTLELSNRSVTYPVGVAEDVFVKVGKFYFLGKFVVVDYDVDPRVPLILGRPFLKTARALIDVYREELTLRVNDEAITDRAFLRIPDELSHLDDDYYNTEGDILYLKKLLNDPSSDLPPMKNGDLKQVDVTMTKPSIEEPPELELKDLTFHLKYSLLEGTNKLPVIISKELKDKEKATLLKALKLHKRAIAWKIFDIKGIDPHFCTHKIIMEDDFKLEVQHQRRMNSKIHEVIKKEVIKILDVGLIYPISDSPSMSLVHCVPKKGRMTVDANEYNELIHTRLVTGWHETMKVFIDDFSVFEDSFSSCLSHLDKMLKRCEDTNLVLNWEKCHFMVKEGIVLGHKISKSGIEVDRAKVDVIAKQPHPTSVK